MAKWITVGTVAALLFAAGLIAGHSVPFGDSSSNTGRAESPIVPHTTADNASSFGGKDSSVPARTQTSNSAAQAGSEPISFVSHTNTADPSEFQSVEMQPAAASSEHRAAIRQLIERHLPGTDASVAEIWVETYADMDLEELEFILEQKRQSPHMVSSELSLPPLSEVPAVGRDSQESDFSVDVVARVVQGNLRGAWSVGYRRMVVLPEAPWNRESPADAEFRGLRTTRFRSFEPGSLMKSPIPTHVALSNESLVMFRLDDDTLTRRGDFQILADRRLGIVTSRWERASADSIPLPETATQVYVAANGTIKWLNAAGDTGEAGRITVCRVTDLSQLQTDDGVFFTTSNVSFITSLDNASAFLRTNALEQSNVDRVHEESLLSYLRSLPADAIGRITN